MDGMCLCRPDTVRFSFADARRKSPMCGSNMPGNVRKHVFTALDIFVKKIRRELRIKNARRTSGKKYQNKNRDDSDKQARDDEPIAQAPQHAVASPRHQPEEEVDAREDGEIFQEIEGPAADVHHTGETACQQKHDGSKIRARKAPPQRA